MRMVQQADNPVVAVIFFPSCIIICYYFLLNLTVAVMLEKFNQLNQQRTNRVLQYSDQNQRRLQELRTFESLVQIRKHMSYRSHFRMFFKTFIYKQPDEPPTSDHQGKPIKRYQFSICRLCFKINQIPLFHTIVLVLIITNTVILTTDQYPPLAENLIDRTGWFFDLTFTVELVIKLIGLQFREWRNDKMNVFDSVIVLSQYVELIG
jgi:hypothetical protein